MKYFFLSLVGIFKLECSHHFHVAFMGSLFKNAPKTFTGQFCLPGNFTLEFLFVFDNNFIIIVLTNFYYCFK